jgi:hypothetical protein
LRSSQRAAFAFHVLDMKQILLVLLLALFAAQTFAQAKEIDLRVNNVGLGTSQSTVLRRLGKPLQSRKTEFNDCGDGFEKNFSYSGLKTTVLSDNKGKNFTAVSFEVSSPKWSVSGIKIGADRKSVRAKFGEPLEIKNESGLESWSYVNKGNDGFAGFYFRNNKLVKIAWESVLC